MVRRRPRVQYCRSDDSPLLTFELLKETNTSDQNSPDAVVFMPDDNAMRFKGKYYQCKRDFTDTYSEAVTEAFMHSDTRLIITVDDDEEGDIQFAFDLCVIPDAEQKTQLSVLIQQHGTDFKSELAELAKGVERVKTLIKTFGSKMEGICPGFDSGNYYAGYAFTRVPSVYEEMRTLRVVETGVQDMVKLCNRAFDEPPFTRKRKAPEEEEKGDF